MKLIELTGFDPPGAPIYVETDHIVYLRDHHDLISPGHPGPYTVIGLSDGSWVSVQERVTDIVALLS